MERRRDREREIQAAVAEIRTIEERDGVTRESLERMLLPSSDFPPPARGSKLKSCLYPEGRIHIFPAHADIPEAR